MESASMREYSKHVWYCKNVNSWNLQMNICGYSKVLCMEFGVGHILGCVR